MLSLDEKLFLPKTPQQSRCSSEFQARNTATGQQRPCSPSAVLYFFPLDFGPTHKKNK